MCGIAGFFARGAVVPPETLEKMTLALAHRGPDDQGFFGVGEGRRGASWKQPGEREGGLEVGLGFRRLSILDLSSNGAQPMTTEDGRFTLDFNGQIYNYIELRREMSGASFKSTSDTEVLLRLLADRGLEALPRLDGMFAFALYDRERHKLDIVRDPLGIKPLYYFEDERGFFFSSEIRSLLTARQTRASVKLSLLSRYFMTGWIPDPDTLFDGIRKLEPGHYLSVSAAGVTKHRYWDLSFNPEPRTNLDEWVEELDAALKTSVERQLRSDVPVAFFLSGGVDSSLLAVKAIEVQKERPATFTIGFKWSGSGTDDLDLKSARLLRDKFPFAYNEIILEPSIVSLLPKVVATLEEPIADAAAICSYLICEAASKKYKVLISGQGGDELFGGYPVYQAGWLASGMQAIPSSVMSAVGAASRRIPYSLAGHQIQNVHRLKKLIHAAQRPWPDPFMLLRAPMRPEQAQELIAPDVYAIQEDAYARHRQLFARARHWDRFHQMMYLDTKTYLPSLNLAYSDKTSMAHSVELRVPLLDMEIVNLVQRMSSRMKLDIGHAKTVLKAVAKKYLPPEIVYRKKAGFGLPLRNWFLKDLQPLASELLSEDRLRRQGLLNPSVPARWLKEHREMTADHCMKLYSLMTFQLWLDEFKLV